MSMKPDGIVAIPKGKNICGMGILITRSHVITCAHVIKSVLGLKEDENSQPAESVNVLFPFENWSKFSAKVIHWFPPKNNNRIEFEELEDLALLELSNPVSFKPAVFTQFSNIQGKKIWTFRVKEEWEHGTWAKAEIIEAAANGWLQVDSLRPTGMSIEKGYSGSGAWIEDDNAICGIVVAVKKHDRIGYLIPHSKLRKFCEVLNRVPNRSLSSVEEKLSQLCHSPIVIAIETENDTIEQNLPIIARHLTIHLSSEEYKNLCELSKQSNNQSSNEQLIEIGNQIFKLLCKSQPRLKDLLKKVSETQHSQPLEWTGYVNLLLEIAPALQCMHFPPDVKDINVKGFVQLNCGDHYFNPISRTGKQRRLPKRNERDLTESVIPRINDEQEAQEENQSSASQAKTFTTQALKPEIFQADVLSIVSKNATEIIRKIIGGLKQTVSSPTRILISSSANIEHELLDETLSLVPTFINFNYSEIGITQIHEQIKSELKASANSHSVASIIAKLRRKWIKEKNAFVEIHSLLKMACWSWVGRPLYSNGFGELLSPAYPHLLDIRSINSMDWYFQRKDDIPKEYLPSKLISPKKTEDFFHLYVSGAGGTGKSCFLRSVFEKLLRNPNVLPIWYRVDSPNSNWADVEKRLKQIITDCISSKYPDCQYECQAYLNSDLDQFLPEIFDSINSKYNSFSQIVIFIDQLERTFESGDKPEPGKLQEVATNILKLLQSVGVGKGIRFFIASRKQYLPDFIRSYQSVKDSGLHFNVLQNINDNNEQANFIQQVINYCIGKNVILANTSIPSDVAQKLALEVKGHPLDMVLSLIELMLHNPTKISKATLDSLRPWERLFQTDITLIGKDKLDWHFLLAMAHARTEIVSIEQIWWRIRMVSPQISRRAEALGQKGLVERQWLHGHLGRSIYPRPDGSNPAAFVEFFHANLRDYLLNSIMQQPNGTPPAWRALDRLADAAREWAYFQRILSYEDVESLMEHRDALLDPLTEEGPLGLLFQRDRESVRKSLCDVGKECLALSCISHKVKGTSTLRQLFPDPDLRANHVVSWLHHSPYNTKLLLLQVLIEEQTPEANDALLKLLLESNAEISAGIAQLLSQGKELYRFEFVTTVLEHYASSVVRSGSEFHLNLPKSITEFLGRVSRGNRGNLIKLILECAKRLSASLTLQGPIIAKLLESNDTIISESLKMVSEDETTVGLQQIEELNEFRSVPVFQIELAQNILPEIEISEIEKARQLLIDLWGIPLPACTLNKNPSSDLAKNEAQFRIRGVLVASCELYPGKHLILREQWDNIYSGPPPGSIQGWEPSENAGVYWVEPEYLEQIEWNLRQFKPIDVLTRYMGEILRRHLDDILDLELVNEFVRLSYPSLSSARRDLFQAISLYDLRQVLVNLVHEKVYLSSTQKYILERLRMLLISIQGPDTLSEKLRVNLGRSICFTHATQELQLPATAFHPKWENRLEQCLQKIDDSTVLLLEPRQIQNLVTMISNAHRRIYEQVEHWPILICGPSLRLPLYRLIEQFDRVVYILSYAELTEAVNIRVRETIGTELDLPKISS